jgi:hypothetical protein
MTEADDNEEELWEQRYEEVRNKIEKKNIDWARRILKRL